MVPLFYERGDEGIPYGWLEMMKNSLQSLCPYFNTSRMVREYAEKFYLPLGAHHARLMADERTPAKSLSDWKERVHRAWPGVDITRISMAQNGVVPLGAKMRVEAEVSLGNLSPEEVRLEIYEGRLKEENLLSGEAVSPMVYSPKTWAAAHTGFHGEIECRSPGMHGVSVRARAPSSGTSFTRSACIC